jgi:hypothetical protein
VWIDTWTIRDQGGNRIIALSLEPNHWEEKILNRMALIDDIIRVAIVPSAKAIEGVRGAQEGGAVVFSFECDQLIRKTKPHSAQSCHHSVVTAMLQLLRSIDLTQRIRISTPMVSVERHVKHWRTAPERWRTAHSFKVTMELLGNEYERHTGVVLETRATNKLSEFDSRYTEEYICTDPERWKPQFTKDGLDEVRKLAGNARVEVPPRVEIATSTRGIILHDRNLDRLFEGPGNGIAERIFDGKRMEFLREYHRTRDYVSKDTHPYTWEYVAHHSRRTLIWRMRCGVLPLEAFVKEIGLPHNRFTAFDGCCACSQGDEKIEETTGHMLVECPLYGDIRRCKRKHKNPTAKWTPLREKLALGWVPEVKFPPDGKLEERKKAAKRAISAAIKIWQMRNEIRSKLPRTDGAVGDASEMDDEDDDVLSDENASVYNDDDEG